MRKFIKKFESALLADNYAIVDIPFITSIATDHIQNLACNQTGKKLVNNNGIVIVYPPDSAGPSVNEIWYWGEYYDLANVISTIGEEFSYKGPAVVSNEKIGDKYVITFNGPVTKLGVEPEELSLYPVFVNISEMGMVCNITRIDIPNSVTSIGERAFGGCSGLTLAIIDNGVTSIDTEAFKYCTGLTSIEIPDSVTYIGEWAFSYCSGLTSVTIGNGVTNIGSWTFYDCSSLTSVLCSALTPPTIGSGCFNNTNNCWICVYDNLVNTYKEAWPDYASRICASSSH